MPTRTEGQAENYMNKLHDAIERGGIKYFLSTNLGELSRFAPKDEHPDKWAAITSGDLQEKPYTQMKAVYELLCEYTDERLITAAADRLKRGVWKEEGSE